MVARRTNPWKAFWDTATGRTVPSDLAGGRAGAAATQAVRALGANLMDMHGARAFNIFSQDMLVGTATREFTTYLPAAARLSRRLSDDPDMLANANRTARDAALDRGRTVQQAEEAGNNAQQQLFKRLAREAGFPNWEVAARMRQADLLNHREIELYMAIASEGGHGRFGRQRGIMQVSDIDFTEMAEAIATLPPAVYTQAEKAMLSSFQNRAINSIEDMVRRFLSEPAPFNSLTDPMHRTAYGRMANIMFSYSRAWADNHILALAERPSGRALGTIALFMFGDTIGRIARRMLRGENWEDIEADMGEDPIRWAVSNALWTPMLGHTQPFVEMAADSLLGNRQTDMGSIGAGPGVRDMSMGLMGQALMAPAELLTGNVPQVVGTADKLAQRMVPIYGFTRNHLMDNEAEQQQSRRRRNTANPQDLFD
jgi:hypothetical protein